MGARNAMHIFTYWWHLPAPAFRAALYMALVTKDNDPEPRYWGGRDALVKAIGKDTPPEPAPDDKSRRAAEFRRRRNNDFESLRIAVKTLTGAGLLAVENHTGPGRPAVYKLNLAALAPPGTPQTQPGEHPRLSPGTPQTQPGNTPDSARGEDGAPLRGAPSKEEEEIRGIEEDENWSPKVPVSSAISTAGCPQIPDFDAARTLLESFPDFGQSWLNRPEVKRFTGTENRYIAAAELALQEMRRLPGTGTGAS
jgi:hypothetical protein